MLPVSVRIPASAAPEIIISRAPRVRVSLAHSGAPVFLPRGLLRPLALLRVFFVLPRRELFGTALPGLVNSDPRNSNGYGYIATSRMTI
ncbi:hypothetical protein GCM10009679_60200 [Saccharothrix algeriensis]|uniref:Uncharacterized protein n=1 Tax=Catellatospora bangladeshensis TaxID=310355 RepID=A0A8J3NLX7_9ACTN|nr:hypothetical protein Cba03nite_69790 [Catellatospora bangladeshensis]